MSNKQNTMVFTPNPKPKRWRKHMGFVVRSGGVAYVSPALAGMTDMVAAMSISWDGATIMTVDGHTLVPSSWLIAEVPACRRIVEAIMRAVEAEASK